MVLGLKMAYPGLTLAIMVGVAIGTAIYYYFNSENTQRQNPYQYDNSYDYDSDYNSWNANRAPSTSSGSSQKRRRRNSGNSQCSICLEDIRSKGAIKTITECGHEFHEHCISIWFRQSRNCPNCRGLVTEQ